MFRSESRHDFVTALTSSTARHRRYSVPAMSREDHDVDWLIVGSGFGGSVAALRLEEKGYRVLVLESGRRFEETEYAERTSQLRRY